MTQIKKTIFFSLLLSFCFQLSYSQFVDESIKKPKDQEYLKTNFREGESLIDVGNIDKALNLYIELDSIFPDNGHLKYKVGYCYVNSSSNKIKAIPFLETAKKSVSPEYTGAFDDTSAAIQTFLHLGKAYQLDDKIVSAIDNYKKFKYYLNKYYKKEDKDELLKNVDRKIETCYNAKKLMANPLDIKVDNLGNEINSKSHEYSPIISADGTQLFFTSRRESSTGGQQDISGKYFEDIFVCNYNAKKDKWSNPHKISDKINTDGHEASVSISFDGKQLFIYHDDQGDGNIYVSKFENEEWGTPEDLGPEINSISWETHACLSPDNNTLYFVSDRKGGHGGRDIWISERMANDSWSKAVNLGPKVNTEYDEEAPFILSDGVTLYFSSKGHESMGGFDNFVSTLSEFGLWSEPENVGYPINTTDDDVFFVPALDEKHAFYSSESFGGFGGQDIYKITILKEKAQVATLKGIIFDADSYQPISAEITITDKSTNDIIADMVSDKISGEYYVTLPIGKQFEIKVTSSKYLIYKENLTTVKAVEINKALMLKRANK